MVWGLQTFMEKFCGNACIHTDIETLITKFKKDNVGLDAVIVVNLRSLLRGFTYGDDNSWMFGGQMKELMDSSIKFVKAFEEIGAKLVFFDGYITERKLPIWLERHNSGIRCAEETIKDMNQGKNIQSFDGCQRLIPAFFAELTKHVFQNVCNCKVFTAFRECDEAMADYARSNKCFAILACDSDFVIYNAAKYYLTTRHLDLRTMTTIRYDSEVLATELGFPVECLPLFATLLGNDVIPKDDLEDFHKKIGMGQIGRRRFYPKKVVVEGVGKYVGEYRNMSAILKNLPQIASKVFESAKLASVIEASIRSYLPNELEEPVVSLDSEWDQIKLEARKLVEQGKTFKEVLPPITDNVVKYGVALETFRLVDLPQSIAVTLALRHRFYGIMMFELPGEPSSIEEWTGGVHTVGDNESFKVEPILPDPGRMHTRGNL